MNPERVSTHGVGGWTRGCRCDECRLAWNAYSRADKRRRRAKLYAQGLTARGTKRKR